uniref:Uncharacterized protein n=1 Tax=Siphoviridae sp. ctzVd36 TaxID=2826530 RepID=A0A8S5M7P9_9CAUD|nr:MAG TPA: hypothetical protein [Siphoviridae sp. ctzVd36]
MENKFVCFFRIIDIVIIAKSILFTFKNLKIFIF